jgi:hypothetical protein
MKSLEEYTLEAIIKTQIREIANLKNLIDDTTINLLRNEDRLWELTKIRLPNINECKGCKRAQASYFCKRCKRDFCWTCLEDDEDSDGFVTYNCGCCYYSW